MIHLITGLPGSGKSLLAIEEILKHSTVENPRPIFTNIKNADHQALGSFPLNQPERWMDLPDGSLVVVDECQHNWPARSSGSKAPEHTLALTEHRHRGFDFIFLTQGPKLIDPWLRDLVERHDHLRRPYQLPYRKRYTYQGCRTDLSEDKEKAVVDRFKINKKLFGYYQSASVHTRVNGFPWKKLSLLLLSLVFVVISGWYVVSSLKGTEKEPQSESPKIDSHTQLASSLPEFHFAGSFISGPNKVLWVADEEGNTFDVASLGAYRITATNDVVLYDRGQNELAIVRDHELARLLW